MTALIKAEFRKLFSLRSTYLVLLFAFLIEVLFAFYISGWRASEAARVDPGYLASQVFSAVNLLGLFAAIVGVLSITHEYRYNTIMYTLTSSSSRTRVVLAKFITISVFAVGFGLVFGWLSPLLAWTGMQMHGIHTVAQQLDVWNLTWRAIFGGWGVAMFASIFAMLARVQVAAIAAIFLIPGTIEPLLGLLLKQNQVYLPYSSLNIVLNTGSGSTPISLTTAVLVSLGYIIGGWVIAWALFLRRDAN
jgi:hypothetical protein